MMCEFEADSWSSPDFARWDKLCIGCRAGVDAMAAAVAANRPVGVRTTVREDRILSLRNELRMSAGQIANQLNIHQGFVQSTLSELRGKGLEVRFEKECGGPLALGAGQTPEPTRRAVPRGGAQRGVDRVEVLA